MKQHLLIGLILGLVLLSACQVLRPEPIPITFNDSVVTEKETQVNIVSTAPKIYHVGSFGREGFSPDFIAIKPGDTIIWNNFDPEKRIMVIVFRNLGNQWEYINSPQVKPRERYSYLFTKVGDYEFWTTEYGVMGKIEVKEI